MNFKRLAKVFMLCIITMSFALQVSAQDQTFRFGLKLSGNLAWIKPNSKNITNTGTGVGYSYGIMGDYHFQEFYALSTELLITQFTSGIEHVDSLTYAGKGYRGVTYDYNFQYLQIPVSLKFKTKEIGYITYWAQFGLAPSFLMSARADMGGNLPANIAGDNPNDVQVNDKGNDKYHFEDFDDKVFFARLPLIIGGGIEYRLAGNASLYAGVRVDNSFTNIFVADDVTSGRNNFVSFSTGVFF